MGPAAAIAAEDVGRADLGNRRQVVAGRADIDDIAIHRHRDAKAVVGRCVRGQQLRLLAPGKAVISKDVSGSRLGTTSIVARCTDDDAVDRNGNGVAEFIPCRAIGCVEDRHLCPGETVVLVDVGATGAARIRCADDDGIEQDRHRSAKGGSHIGIAGGDLHLWLPGHAIVAEDVHRPGVDAGRVIAGRADHHHIGRDRHRRTEGGAATGVEGHQLLFQQPRIVDLAIYIRSPGIGDGEVVQTRPHHRHHIFYGDGRTEIIGAPVEGLKTALGIDRCRDAKEQSQEPQV